MLYTRTRLSPSCCVCRSSRSSLFSRGLPNPIAIVLFLGRKRRVQVRNHIRQQERLVVRSAAIDAPQEIELKVEVVEGIDQVSQADWDRLVYEDEDGCNPFVLWTFLKALEDSGSAVSRQGWLPQHVLVRAAEGGHLVGACPMYLKGHSQGEYVFDHSWAAMSHRTGTRYYPKLQSCVPFSPVGGPRLLVGRHPHADPIRAAIGEALIQLTDQLGVSGTHITFNKRCEWEALEGVGFLSRSGIQYHWDNAAPSGGRYTTFDDFLTALKQSKRKNIRQERKAVAAAGLRVRRLTGDDIRPLHWDNFFEFYMNTCDNKWGSAYLTRDFFQQLGETMASRVLLVVAQEAGVPDDGPLVAGALNLIGDRALFGRNWGCSRYIDIKHLHFELCYYQAQEAAIERGLERVEAGAQGEHKLQRGYLPSQTFSSHYLREPLLRGAVTQFLRRERSDIDFTLRMLTEAASPYKQPPGCLLKP